ncbi:MAG: hypothetical protein WC769_01575 [Thermodesulfovibrionales bacterium]|jgi:hypothetical protein
MRFPRKRGSTSVIVRVFIPDNTSTTGAGLTGLTYQSTNLAISYSRELQNGCTQITGVNILDITTIGTWLDPTAGKVRFKAVDATNAPGLYELQFADAAAFGTGDLSQNVIINVLELTTIALKIGPNMVMIPLVPWDYQDGIRMGLTGLANAVPGAENGLALVGSVMGKGPATLNSSDVSGNLPVDKTGYTLTSTYDAAMTAAQAGDSMVASNMVAAPDNTTIGFIAAALADGTIGLVALKNLLEAIDTSTELQARFTEIKGTGWANETLKAIKDLVGSGMVMLVLPAMQAGISSSYIIQGAEVKIKRGDDVVKPFQIAGDWHSWSARFGAKVKEVDEEYAVGPITLDAGIYDSATDSTLFLILFTSAHTATAYRKLYAEIELTNGDSTYTPLEFFLTIKQDVVRD